jgi:hypothetical protein
MHYYSFGFGFLLVAIMLFQACRLYHIADSLLLDGMTFNLLSNVPDSERAAKGLLRVFLFNLKISSKI